MSKKSTKAVAKKSVAKKVSTKATKKPNALHEKLIALLTRKDGATMTDGEVQMDIHLPLKDAGER